ncbi:uncharacterized protein LOC127005709 [Eriocheir sinensis]|uniref:uncharacterized protein LOC127005709 n=1 Tax=Eriocheir sinensis TaxID=95602 RepID=UPI0021CAB7B5|nr:uncharacterized protein LOC127005709 [Eriocheir sinensis]XP_050730786.1 uncharacterized protein LOC127005709 [Eriocheir sinensis]
MDSGDDFEMVEGNGIPSSCYPTSPHATFRARHLKTSSTQGTNAGPTHANPSSAKESYMSSLRSAFSRMSPGNERKEDPKKKPKKRTTGKGGQGKPGPSPPPPPSSRRSSFSSDSSLESQDLDSIAGVFSAALSFAQTCDRRAAAINARTKKNHPLDAAYEKGAKWGGALGGGKSHGARQRSSKGWSFSSDEEDSRPRSSSSSSSSVFGLSTFVNTVFGRRRKQ